MRPAPRPEPAGGAAVMEEPYLSVVIACVNGTPSILKCLDALVDQEGDVPYEVLVMDRCGERVRQAVRERFPQPEVSVHPVEGYPSIPRLRALGLARARGRLVAILEDHCNVNRRWMLAARRAHEAGHRVLGGPVENGATRRLVDWAVFYVEYARFMPPVATGVVDAVAGSSALYERALLEAIGSEIGDEVWESFLHARMKDMGVPFYCDPGLVVSHDKEFGFWYFMSQRYHYSRSFAGMRLDRQPAWKRVAYAAATPLLPALLLLRMARVLAPKGHAARFALALPVLLPFLASYGWGEAVGALLGPGDSLARVE